MKAKVKSLAMLIVAVLVAVFTVGNAFAWFFDKKVSKFLISGASAGAYFESGDGSKETPFIISNATHMRNLAVLQNTGRFGDTKYYFEIKKTLTEPLNMGGIWLPPIGSDDNPFIGDFNGNGKTIKNLKVTTDKALLNETNYPTQASAAYEFSQAVGLFGNTGKVSNISNFILDNPHVVVGAVGVNNNKYKTGAAKTVGIAVGHVAGKCSSIGVLATDDGTSTTPGVGSTALDVRVIGYSTFNSILGELGEGVESSVTGGGSGNGGGAGGAGGTYGNTFDVETLYTRLKSIAGAKYGTEDCVKNEALTANPLAWRLPSLDNSSQYWTLGKGDKLAFAKTGDHYSENEPYEEVADDSTGYFLGNQTKIQYKTINYASQLALSADRTQYYATNKKGETGSPGDLKVTPAWLYTQPNGWQNSNYQVGFGFAPISQATFNNLPRGIKNLVDFKAGESNTFTTVRAQAQYTQTLPSGGRWPQLTDEDWSYHGQITWNGNTYGVGLKSDPYDTKNKFSYPYDEYGHRYTYDGYPVDENSYKFNADYSYVINKDGWNTPVFTLNSNGEAVLVTADGTFSYYVDENLIDENGYLFNFEDGERRYVSALEGWALPIYGVDANGYALDENGDRYSVNDFYTLDENGYYKRANGTYVIKTANWDTPIYVIDENGYAMTEDGGLYYTTTLGVYQMDGTCKYYDENGNGLILVDGQYIRPYGFDEDGYAVTADGLYYTSTAGSYLKYENDAYYRVDENGTKQIDHNGRIVTPYGFDEDGYAVNDMGFYYNKTDTNVFYDKRISTQYGNATTVYYQINKSASAGNIWTYVPKSGSLTYSKIDDNGYAMYNDDWRYTTAEDIYADANNYNLHGNGGYILNTGETWTYNNLGYFGDDGIFYATPDAISASNVPDNVKELLMGYVKGAYYVDTLGYVITTTGAYALDDDNNITGDKILYHINSSGELTYSTGPHAGQRVTYYVNWGSESPFKAVNNGYSRIETATGDAKNLATAITGAEEDRLQQAEGTLADRVQATHDSEFTHNHVMVKTAEDSDRPKGVSGSGDLSPFHQMMGGIFLPNNGIWFKPARAGMIRFVMYADSTDQNFALLKVERQPHADGSVSFDDTIVRITKVLQQKLPSYCMFYYEYEVSQDDIDAGNVEFVIMRDNDDKADVGGSFLLYLDLGASAIVEGDDDVSGFVPDKVSAVDFIYDGVEIEQSDETIGVGNFFIVDKSGETEVKKLYNASKTSVYFSGINNALKVVYVRLNEEGDKHSGKTICLEHTKTSDLEEVYATYPSLVCPTVKAGTASGNGGGGTVTPTPDPGPDTPDDVAVTSVTLNKNSMTLTSAGATEKLTATVAPNNATNKSVTWTSSNEGVATVDSSGNVTAVANGTATITVTTADGSKTATCTVTVDIPETPTPPPSGTDEITLSKYSTISGNTFKATSDSGYFEVESVKNYTYYENHASFGPSLVATSNDRGLKVTANTVDGVDYSSIKITLKVAIATSGNFTGTTATIQCPAGVIVTYNGTTTVCDSEKEVSITTTGSGKDTICEIEITLSKGQSVTIGSGRFAFIGASSVIVS